MTLLILAFVLMALMASTVFFFVVKSRPPLTVAEILRNTEDQR